MAREIELPDGTIAEFPDDMSDQAITEVLQKQFPQPVKADTSSNQRKDWTDHLNKYFDALDWVAKKHPLMKAFPAMQFALEKETQKGVQRFAMNTLSSIGSGIKYAFGREEPAFMGKPASEMSPEQVEKAKQYDTWFALQIQNQEQPDKITEAVEDIGKNVSSYWAEKRDKFAADPEVQGSIIDDPKLLANKRWWQAQVGELAPQILATYGIGGGTARTVQVMGRRMLLNPTTTKWLTRAMAGGAGSTHGSYIEAASTYEEALSQGKTQEEASKAAEGMFIGCMIMNAISVGHAVGPKAKDFMFHYLKNGPIEAITEYAEEPWEAFLLDESWPEIKHRLKTGVNVIPPALVASFAGVSIGKIAEQKQVPIPEFQNTQEAEAFGKKATPAEIKELEELQIISHNKVQKLKESGDLSEAIAESTRHQLYREAVESSEGFDFETAMEDSYGTEWNRSEEGRAHKESAEAQISEDFRNEDQRRTITERLAGETGQPVENVGKAYDNAVSQSTFSPYQEPSKKRLELLQAFQKAKTNEERSKVLDEIEQLRQVQRSEEIANEPPPPKPAPVVDMINAFETQKDIYFGNRDTRILQINNEKSAIQDGIKESLELKKYTQAARDIDRAVKVHIDLKRAPEDIGKYYNKLTPEQQAIVDLSQSLPQEILPIVERIEKAYKTTGEEALNAEAINNLLENYVSREWDMGGKELSEIYRKFGTTTKHSKKRVFTSILEGWSKGYKLRIEGATSGLATYKTEVIKTIENKKFLEALKKVKDSEGNPLLTDQQLPGYKAIQHPSFKDWRYAGVAKEGEAYGKNFIINPEGTLLERRALYAPEKQADNLNNIFGVSKLKGVPGIDTLTKYNAIFKSWILQTSLFHHLAFMRSYYLGTNHKKWGEMNLRQAYKTGVEFIKNEHPMVMLGVKNGLTLGIRQDWEEDLVREQTIFENVMDKSKVTKQVKGYITRLRQAQSDFLFGEFGAGLKAKAFMIEYRNELKKETGEPSDVIAKRVAGLINDDFGGLHLERMGRDPTLQHILRLLLLAPDWTESNVRSMVKMFPIGKTGDRFYTDKAASKVYRKFWSGIMIKGIGATVLLNYLLSGADWDEFKEKYRKAWKAGNFKWMMIDITGLYKLLGDKSPDRRYFSLLGHFQDPIKFVAHPIRSLHHKGSVIYGVFHEAFAGTDWAGRKFTTMEELAHQGKTVKWGPGGAIEWDQLPSYLISQVIGLQPVQIQNMIAAMAGENDWLSTIFNSAGLNVKTAHTPKKKKKLVKY